jgi:hypothetical protein
MRWTNFLRPERVCALVAKLFLGLFAFILVAHLILSVIASMRLSAAGSLDLLVALALVSVIAYCIRERRKGKRLKPRSTRGAERTPLLPHDMEEA